MLVTIARLWILALCSFCGAQEFRNGKIIGVSDGSTCAPLPNPEHGHFVCKSKNGQENCELKCQDGYNIPITYTPLDVLMDVILRGQFVCKEVPGGVTWVPPILFDCVERRDPKNLMLHFGIDFNLPCDASKTLDPNIRNSLLPKLRGGEIKSKADFSDVTYTVDLFLECIGNVVGDMELAVPFTEEHADMFPAFRTRLDSIMNNQVAKGALKLTGQTNATHVNESGFFTDCPRGTRMESDLTCRGCSKGYFLDPSRSECAPCPPGTYQDEALRAYCKLCPDSTTGQKEGLMKRKQCFHSGIFRKHTSVKTVTWALGWIVIVCTILISYGGSVTKEVSPETPELEVLAEEEDDDFVLNEEDELGLEKGLKGKHGKKEKGNGDFDWLTTRPAMKVDEEIEDKQWKLGVFRLPLEPRPKSKEAKQALARERMRMSMAVNTARHSVQQRRSQWFIQPTEQKEVEDREEDWPNQDSSSASVRQRRTRDDRRSRAFLKDDQVRDDDRMFSHSRRYDEGSLTSFGKEDNTGSARQSMQETNGAGRYGLNGPNVSYLRPSLLEAE